MTDCFTFKDGRGSQALQETEVGGREGQGVNVHQEQEGEEGRRERED